MRNGHSNNIKKGSEWISVFKQGVSLYNFDDFQCPLSALQRNSLNRKNCYCVSVFQWLISDGHSIWDSSVQHLLLSTFLKFHQLNNGLILQVNGLTQSTLADVSSSRSSTNERWVGRQLLDDKTHSRNMNHRFTLTRDELIAEPTWSNTWLFPYNIQNRAK